MATRTKSRTLRVFTGEYRHALDPKNRVTIPSRWRPDASDELMMFPNPSRECLTVMPSAIFEKLGERKPENVEAKNFRIFISHIHSQARPCKPDPQGRLLVPPEFCKKIGIDSIAVLSGSNDCFEIWNEKNYDKHHAQTRATAAEVADAIGL